MKKVFTVKKKMFLARGHICDKASQKTVNLKQKEKLLQSGTPKSLKQNLRLLTVVGYHGEITMMKMITKMGLFKLVFTKHFTRIMSFTLQSDY